MKIKAYSVRLKSLVSISDRAFKATTYDGRSAIIPKSQVWGVDNSVSKSDAYWISAWILEKKDIQYSTKKVASFNDSGEMVATYKVEKHTPERITNLNTIPDENLIRHPANGHRKAK